MDDCIFCKIGRDEIPAWKVYEDEHVFAILDNSQVTKGHTLIIPKEHIRNIFDYSSVQAQKIFTAVPKVANALKAHNSEVKGLNILVNNEEIAQQTVFHSHIHLIPRYSSDDGYEIKWETHEDKYSDEELNKLQQDIKKAAEEVQ